MAHGGLFRYSMTLIDDEVSYFELVIVMKIVIGTIG